MKTTPVTTRYPKEVLAWIDAQAAKLGVKRATMIAILMKELKARDEKS
jgi:hypothetical protein